MIGHVKISSSVHSHKWLFNYPAQIALTTSQIIWSEEVNAQFDAFQDGNEQAMKEYIKGSFLRALECFPCECAFHPAQCSLAASRR